jgi:hypothetical protein
MVLVLTGEEGDGRVKRLSCPSCEGHGPFSVDTIITVRLTDDQEIDHGDIDLDRDIFFNDQDNVFCPKCEAEFPYFCLFGGDDDDDG